MCLLCLVKVLQLWEDWQDRKPSQVFSGKRLSGYQVALVENLELGRGSLKRRVFGWITYFCTPLSSLTIGWFRAGTTVLVASE